MHRHPNSDMTVLENFYENLLSTNHEMSTKDIVFAGDLNINVSDYKSDKKFQHVLSSRPQYNMMPTIN